MNTGLARNAAHQSHAGQRDRFGELMIDHVERVASALPEEVRALGYVHDVLERTQTKVNELRAIGMTDAECGALELLTRRPHESYTAHVQRIAGAGGDSGRLARMVKLADLDDHLRHQTIPPDAPNYEWARCHIVAAASPHRPPRGSRRQHQTSQRVPEPAATPI